MPNFFNKYPYTDFHELNLDWVLTTVKDLYETVHHMDIHMNDEMFVNIADFGAKTDAAPSDNSEAIANAIATGKSIYVPSGVFTVSDDITFSLNDNTSIYCDGYIKVNTTRTQPLFEMLNKKNLDIKLRTICEVVPASTYYDHALILSLRGCENVWVHDGEYLGSMTDAIYLSRNYDIGAFNCCKNVVVERNRISNCKRNSIALVTGENIVINDNYITSPNDGNIWNVSCVIDVEPNRDGEVLKDIKIINNKIDASSSLNKSLIRFNIGGTKRPDVYENIEVSYNILTCYNNPDIAVYMDGNMTNSNHASNITFEGNVINNSCQEGFRLIRTSYATVKHNVIEHATTEGILMSYGVGNYTVKDNYLNLIDKYGIHFKNNAGSCYQISNNYINADNSAYDSLLFEGNNATSDLSFISNVVEGTGTSSLKITGNTDSICAFNLLAGSLTDTYTTNNNNVTNKVNGSF